MKNKHVSINPEFKTAQTICLLFLITFLGMFNITIAYCASFYNSAYGGVGGVGGSCDGDYERWNPRSGDGLISVNDGSCNWSFYSSLYGDFSGVSSAAAYGSDTSWHGIISHHAEGLGIEPMADTRASASASQGEVRCFAGWSNASASALVFHRLRERTDNPLPPDTPNLLEILNNVPISVSYRFSASASECGTSGASLEIMPYGIQEATNNALGPRNGTLSFVAATGTTFSIKASSSALARAALEGCMNCPKNGSAQAVADPFAHIDPDWEYAEHFVVEQESVLNPGSWVEVTRIWQTFCEADFDSDVDVDGKDFFDFLADYERSDCDGDCQSDFDEDGNVDENDLQFIIADFGKVNCTEF